MNNTITAVCNALVNITRVYDGIPVSREVAEQINSHLKFTMSGIEIQFKVSLDTCTVDVVNDTLEILVKFMMGDKLVSFRNYHPHKIKCNYDTLVNCRKYSMTV